MNLSKVTVAILVVSIVACTPIETTLPVSSPTATIDLIATEAYQATVDAERTALARFTENPTLALSSTPFYGAILWNEAVRMITTTPTLAPSQPAPECRLIPVFWRLNDFETALVQTLMENDVEAHVESFVSVVWAFERCEEYMPVSNRIRIWLDAPTFDDEIEMGNAASEIISIIETELMGVNDISPSPASIILQICFKAQTDTMDCIYTTWDVALNNRDLSGSELIAALGGFAE